MYGNNEIEIYLNVASGDGKCTDSKNSPFSKMQKQLYCHIFEFYEMDTALQPHFLDGEMPPIPWVSRNSNYENMEKTKKLKECLICNVVHRGWKATETAEKFWNETHYLP